jgi:hypothetical protein
LRDIFDATPLRLPDTRVVPLGAIAYGERTARFIGPVADMLVDPFDDPPAQFESPIASLTGKRSRKIGIDLGLEILGGFLPALGASPVEAATALSGASHVSLRFDAVTRRFIDVTRLGKALSSHRLDLTNPATTGFVEQRYELLIVDSVFVSPGFTVAAEQSRSREARVATPQVAGVGTVSAGVRTDAGDERAMTFAGAIPLTFAFSCVRLFVDEAGELTSIEARANAPTLGFGGASIVRETPNRVLLSEQSELLDWD